MSQDLNLLALPDLSDLTPLVLVAGFIVGAFVLCFLFLVPIAVFSNGAAGRNAHRLIKQLVGLFHSLLEVFKHHGCGR